MRERTPITEAEMIAVFLKGELASSRFGPQIEALLRRDGRSPDVIRAPDLHDEEVNHYRRAVLDAYRGFDARTGLFDGFPRDVRWVRALLTPAELGQVRYINYIYWNELSGGSRRPADAAAQIAAGREAFGVSNEPFWAIAAALAQGAPVPEPIFVGTGQAGDLVALEGHLRLTAYFLRPAAIPLETEAIIGTSPELRKWTEY